MSVTRESRKARPCRSSRPRATIRACPTARVSHCHHPLGLGRAVGAGAGEEPARAAVPAADLGLLGAPTATVGGAHNGWPFAQHRLFDHRRRRRRRRRLVSAVTTSPTASVPTAWSTPRTCGRADGDRRRVQREGPAQHRPVLGRADRSALCRGSLDGILLVGIVHGMRTRSRCSPTWRHRSAMGQLQGRRLRARAILVRAGVARGCGDDDRSRGDPAGLRLPATRPSCRSVFLIFGRGDGAAPPPPLTLRRRPAHPCAAGHRRRGP